MRRARTILVWFALVCVIGVGVVLRFLRHADPSDTAAPTTSTSTPQEVRKSPSELEDSTQLPVEDRRESAEPAVSDTEIAPANVFFGLVQLIGGAPSPRTRVAVYQGCSLVLETETDGAGYFQVALPTSPDACALVHLPELSAVRVDLVPGHSSRETALPILLSRSAAMFVRVLNTDRKPIAGLQLQFTTKPVGAAPNHQMESELTGVDGCCLLAGVPPITLALDIWRGNAHLQRDVGFQLKPGTITERESVLGGGAHLSGLALDQNGIPVTEAAIELCRPWDFIPAGATSVYFSAASRSSVVGVSVTDELGHFDFMDVTQGSWWIGAQGWTGVLPQGAKSGKYLSPLATRVEILPTDQEVSVTLHVERGLTIEGQVQSADGKPLAKRSVTAEAREQGGSFSTTTLDDGRFVIPGLSPGEFLLRAEPGQGMAAPSTVRASAGAKDVILITSAGVVLAGKVTDGGKPCAGWLSVWNGAPLQPDVRRGLGSDGGFQLDGLPPGEYVVIARTAEGRIGIQTRVARDGDRFEDLLLTVEPGSSLTLHCEKRDGESIRGRVLIRSEMAVVAWTELASNLPSKPVTVPTGTLEVVFTPDGGAPMQQFVTSVVGVPSEVVFRVP
jgi:carboxypeptidase family protein